MSKQAAQCVADVTTRYLKGLSHQNKVAVERVLKYAQEQLVSGAGVITTEQMQHLVNQVKREMIESKRLEVKKNKDTKTFLEEKIDSVTDNPVVAMQTIADLNSTQQFRRQSENMGAGTAIDKQIQTEKSRVHKELTDLLESATGKKAGIWREWDEDFMDQVLLAKLGGRVTNPQARKVADAWEKIELEFVNRQRDRGAKFDVLENRGPRIHNPALIDADADSWREFMKMGLDAGHHPKTDEAVEQIYKSVTNAPYKHRGADFTISEAREVFFDTPEIELDYFKRFSGATVFEAMTADLDKLIRNTVLVEQRGVQPYKVTDQAIAEIDNRAAKLGIQKTAEYQRARANAVHTTRALRQVTDDPKVPSRAGWIGIMRTFLASGLLSKAVTASLGFDTIVASWNVKALNGQGWSSVVSNMFSNATNKGLRDAVERWGVISDSMIGGTMSHLAPVDHMFGNATRMQKADKVANKLLATTMRWSGLSKLTQSQQRGTATAYLQSMANIADVPFDQIAKHDDWLAMRLKAAGVRPESWNRAITSEAVDRQLGIIDIDKIQDADAARELSAFLAREVDIAVTRPDIMTQYLASFGTEAGTYKGEITRSVMQFQGFFIQYTQNIWGTARQKGVSIDNTAFLAAMIGMGVMKSQVDQALSDKPFYEYDSPVLWTSALDKSGLFYLAGAMAHGVNFSTQATGTPASLGDVLTDTVTGPLVGYFFDTASLVTKAGIDIMSEEYDMSDADLARAFKQVTRAIPMLHLLYYSRWVMRGTNMAIERYIDPEYGLRQADLQYKLGQF
jgi:hypothetical protein